MKPLHRTTVAVLTIYRFAWPNHFNYLMSMGMGVRWMPTWFLCGLPTLNKDDSY